MSCYHPIKAYRVAGGVSFVERARDDHLGDVELPCGKCVGCLLRRGRDWALRMRHEASCWEDNCFLTLTFDDDHLPVKGGLDHREWQLFMKKLRYEQAETTVRSDMCGPIRFFMCGEYGPKTGRPHFHACMFNLGFTDSVPVANSGSGQPMFESATLTRLWGKGHATVQPFDPAFATYVGGYVVKGGTTGWLKNAPIDTETGELVLRQKPYGEMSRMPYRYLGKKMPGGIGARWFEQYKKDIERAGDAVIADGYANQTPAYYDKLYARCEDSDIDEIKYKRYLDALKRAKDNTAERLAVRERVQLAKLRNKERNSI